MKIILTLLGIVSLFLPPALAQQMDNPVAVPVSYYGDGPITSALSGSFSFGAELGAVSSYSGSGTPGTFAHSSLETVYLLPGKTYNVNVMMAGSISAVFARFLPSSECEIYINGKKQRSIGSGPSAYNFQLRIESKTDIARSLANTRGGQCTSFPEDKPIWYVGLGTLRNGRFAGALGFRAQDITADLYNTSSLIYDSVDTSEVNVTRDSNGYITQIESRDVIVSVDPYNSTGTSYKIYVYKASGPGPLTPYITYTIQKTIVAGGAGIRVDKLEDGVTWTTELKKDTSTWTLLGWRLNSGGTYDTSKSITTVVSGATSSVTNGAGTGEIKKEKIYTVVNGRTELSSLELGPGTTSAPKQSYTYHTSSIGNGWPGSISTVTEPTGRWTAYHYYNAANDSRAGQIQWVYRPWQDSPATVAYSGCDMQWFDYAANFDGSTTALSFSAREINGTRVAWSAWAYNWTFSTVNGHTIAEIEQQDHSSSSAYLTTRTLAYRDDDPTSFFRGKIHATTKPNGTKDSYAYFYGTWNPPPFGSSTFTEGAAGADRLILVFHGQALSGSSTNAISSWTQGGTTWAMDTVYLQPNYSTVSEIVVGSNGRVIFEGEYIYTASGLERISGSESKFSANNLLESQTDVVRSVPGGEVKVSFGYVAGLMTSKVDSDGTQTTWGFDSLLRQATITTAATGSGNYPAHVQTTQYYDSGLASQVEDGLLTGDIITYSYESTGRVASTNATKPGGGSLSTTTAYPTPVKTVTTLPTLATLISEVYLDGRAKSETGSGQIPKYFSYGYSSLGINRVVQSGAGTDRSNGWTEELVDWLGRPISQRAPQVGWSSSLATRVVSTNFTYAPTSGLLTLKSTVDEAAGGLRLIPDHYYLYGDFARLEKEGDDIGQNASLDDASDDRITKYSTVFFKDALYSGWVRQEDASVLRSFSNPTNIATVSKLTRFTRFNGGALKSGDIVTSDVSIVDASGRASSDEERISPSIRNRANYHYEQGVANPSSMIWQDGYLKSEQSVSSVILTHSYNNRGLKINTAEGTTNASTDYVYVSGTKYLLSVSQTTGPSSVAVNTYGYAWDTAAQTSIVSTTDLAGGTIYNEFNARGQPLRTWGNATIPSQTDYDAHGRRTTLKTWQSGGSWTGPNWPTSPGASQTTTWSLDPATGVTLSKTYQDTTAMSYSYNARGQVSSRTWARGIVTSYQYYDRDSTSFTGELKQTSYNDGVTPTVSYSYTRFGTPSSITDATGTRSFSYRADLKLDTEALSAFYGSCVFANSYDGTGRSNGYSFSGGATASAALTFDSSTGRPATVGGALGGTSVNFTLGYASGTDWVISATSGSFGRSTPLVSRYNAISSATTTWAGSVLGSFTSQYVDARGWRTGQENGSAGGTTAGSWTKVLNLGDGLRSTYAFNAKGELVTAPFPAWQAASGSVSQAARTFSWSYDLLGNRLTENGPELTSYTPDAMNRYSSITGQRAEPGISYDLDGNLIQDAVWAYTYDGENRLKAMTKAGQVLTFVYDYSGRRVRKTVTGTGAYDIKFLWSDWKLAAELAANGSTVSKTFVWGRDFSSAQGAAGGAGSLLAQIDSSSGVSYAISDTLGNIVGYIGSSGQISAAVEYSPFGKGLNVYGSFASYPIGFSGQYMDWEPGMVYYGLRYYAPKHGRFINRDPIEESGGLNLYGFCGNNGLNGWDTLGLDEYDLRMAPEQYRRDIQHFIDRGHLSSANRPDLVGGNSISWHDVGGIGDNFWVSAVSDMTRAMAKYYTPPAPKNTIVVLDKTSGRQLQVVIPGISQEDLSYLVESTKNTIANFDYASNRVTNFAPQGGVFAAANSVTNDPGAPTLAVGGSRLLTTGEIALAKTIYGDQIKYEDVSVRRKKFAFFQPKDIIMTPNGNMYFNPKGNDYRDDFSISSDIDLRAVFVHELVHVWQHQQGVNVMMRGMVERVYKYLPLTPGKAFTSYNIEQQGDIVRDYYYLRSGSPIPGVTNPPPLSTYQSLIPFLPKAAPLKP